MQGHLKHYPFHRAALAMVLLISGSGVVLYDVRRSPRTLQGTPEASSDDAGTTTGTTPSDSAAAERPLHQKIGYVAADTRACQATLDDGLRADASAERATSGASRRFHAAESARKALESGWPVAGPPPLDGALLPCGRIVAYYGNPLSARMGALGAYPPDEMMRRLRREAARWEAADPTHPVHLALHLVAVVAQPEAGSSGKHRTIMNDALIEQVLGWARGAGALLFLDVQAGQSDIRDLLPRLEQYLVQPDIHVGIDPEFMMKDGSIPGRRIGSIDAADINFAAGYLAELVRRHGLRPKVLIVHRFTRRMITGAHRIRLRPEVQIVINMDGWGPADLKRDTYAHYVVSEPVQYTGFKLFYHNDTKHGGPLLTPTELLRLMPKPLYVQYQ